MEKSFLKRSAIIDSNNKHIRSRARRFYQKNVNALIFVITDKLKRREAAHVICCFVVNVSFVCRRRSFD